MNLWDRQEQTQSEGWKREMPRLGKDLPEVRGHDNGRIENGVVPKQG